MEKKENPVKEFLNECAEWHGFWFGIVRSFRALDLENLSPALQADIRNEYHYHMLGYFLGRSVQYLGRLVQLAVVFILGAVIF